MIEKTTAKNALFYSFSKANAFIDKIWTVFKLSGCPSTTCSSPGFECPLYYSRSYKVFIAFIAVYHSCSKCVVMIKTGVFCSNDGVIKPLLTDQEEDLKNL